MGKSFSPTSVFPAAEVAMETMKFSDMLLVAVPCSVQHSLPVEQTLHQRSNADRTIFQTYAVDLQF